MWSFLCQQVRCAYSHTRRLNIYVIFWMICWFNWDIPDFSSLHLVFYFPYIWNTSSTKANILYVLYKQNQSIAYRIGSLNRNTDRPRKLGQKLITLEDLKNLHNSDLLKKVKYSTFRRKLSSMKRPRLENYSNQVVR